MAVGYESSLSYEISIAGVKVYYDETGSIENGVGVLITEDTIIEITADYQNKVNIHECFRVEIAGLSNISIAVQKDADNLYDSVVTIGTDLLAGEEYTLCVYDSVNDIIIEELTHIKVIFVLAN